MVSALDAERNGVELVRSQDCRDHWRCNLACLHFSQIISFLVASVDMQKSSNCSPPVPLCVYGSRDIFVVEVVEFLKCL